MPVPGGRTWWFADQFEFLKDHGCDLIQGYYISKPLPENEFEAAHVVETVAAPESLSQQS